MIYHCDCRVLLHNVGSFIDDRQFSATVTTLPSWGNGLDMSALTIGKEPSIDEYVANISAVFSLVLELTQPGGALWVRVQDMRSEDGSLLFVPERIADGLSAVGWRLSDKVIWKHGYNSLPCASRIPCDWCSIYGFTSPGTRRYFRRLKDSSAEEPVYEDFAKSSVWTASRPRYDELIRRCIEITTEKGDLVFDPFLGRGDTYVAADDLGRLCLGTDVDQEKVVGVLNRIALMRGNLS
jgi:DNA modification methylase